MAASEELTFNAQDAGQILLGLTLENVTVDLHIRVTCYELKGFETPGENISLSSRLSASSTEIHSQPASGTAKDT